MDEVKLMCVYFKRPMLMESFAESCFQFSSQIAIRKDECVFIETERSRRLFQEETLFLRLRALARRFRGEPVIRSARDAGTALAKAMYDSSTVASLPLQALHCWMNPFEKNEEDRAVVDRIISVLRRLGLRTVEEFLMFPPEAVTARFGEEGLKLYHRVRNGFDEPWPLFKPVEKVVESVDIEAETGYQTVGEIEPLFFFIKILVDRVMGRLRGRGERAGSLMLRLRMERGINTGEKESVREWRVPFAVPQVSSVSVAKILREKLDADLNRRPLPAPPSAMDLVVEESVPGIEAQKNFFHNREEEFEELGALFERISEKVGAQRVFMADIVRRHLPEKAWAPANQRSFDSNAVETCDVPRRPTRVLNEPVLLQRDGRLLVSPLDRRLWMTLDWMGPERISGEWWSDTAGRGFIRDYYCVHTQTGEELWVYRDRTQKTPEFYLHGYFD